MSVQAYPQMRLARPSGKRPTFSVTLAIAELKKDAAEVAILSSSLGSALSKQGRHDALGDSQLRAVEQAARALRSYRCKLQRVIAAVCGESASSLLSSAGGSMLQPLRSATEGAEQARRMRPGGHPMYLRAVEDEGASAVQVPLTQTAFKLSSLICKVCFSEALRLCSQAR
jgi:hypothetical protein